MDISPYLQAIQKVAGLTPGEKYKSLNQIAWSLAHASSPPKKKKIRTADTQGMSVHVTSANQVPEILMPLVQLEVAKILQQPAIIIDALKSPDIVLFNRALKIKWFFNGSHENFPNVHYFMTEIFPYQSLCRRQKLIKVLAGNLKNKKSLIAEEFYVNLKDMYGQTQARPVLIACSVSFISHIIKTHKWELTTNEFKYLFFKNPDFIINYFKMDHIELGCLTFLGQLLKRYPTFFFELTDMREYCPILTKKHTKMFLKHGIDRIMKNPHRYVHQMSLKCLTAKLTKERFKELFSKMWPTVLHDSFGCCFSFKDSMNLLQYYPEKERLGLIFSTFEKLYGIKFWDCLDLVTIDILVLLSPEVRVEYARKKLEDDEDWKIDEDTNIVNSWRCYLPIVESIPIIKKKISMTSSVEERYRLLQQLIYTCRINADKNALLEVLKYIELRHINEQEWALLKILKRLLDDFKLQNLTLEHWQILDNLTRKLRINYDKHDESEIIYCINVCRIHFNLIHNLPITKQLEWHIGAVLKRYSLKFSILEENLHYEKQTLEEMINIITAKYQKDSGEQKDRRSDVIQGITNAIYDFNDRNSKAEVKLEMMSIKNYSWIVTYLQTFVKNADNSNRYWIGQLKERFQTWEPDFYNSWFPQIEVKHIKDPVKALRMLKKNPQEIIDHWEAYITEFKSWVWLNGSRKLFFKSSRWYQDLPIKFVDACLKDSHLNDDDSILILALLCEGSTVEKLIAPYTPLPGSVSDDDDTNYWVKARILKSLSLVNPLYSSELLLNYFKHDMHSSVAFLRVLALRMPANQALELAINLLDQPVSIQKQGIRLFCMVANTEQIREMYTKLWKTEKHRSIRDLLYNKVKNNFLSTSDPNAWSIMSEFMDELKIDDTDIIEALPECSKFPHEYMTNYLEKVFATFKRLGEIENGLSPQDITKYTCRVFDRIPIEIPDLLTENFHHQILQTYYFDLYQPVSILVASRGYLKFNYLLASSDNFEERLIYFTGMLVDILKKHWNIPHPDDTTFYPAIYMLDSINCLLTSNLSNDAMKKKRFIDETLKAVCSVVNPREMPTFYLQFKFTSLMDTKDTPQELAQKIFNILPSLVDIYSRDFIQRIAEVLLGSLHRFYRLNNSRTNNEIFLNVMESLLELNNDRMISLTVEFLKDDFFKLARSVDPERHNKIIATLLKSANYSVISKTYEYLNSCEPKSDTYK